LRIDEYFTRTASGTTSTFLDDALGSTIGLVTSKNSSIVTKLYLSAVRRDTVGGSANGNSYEFTGRENDGTGLYFYRARYYSPTFQRFIAQDPIGFRGGDINLYSYAANNPISVADPLGMRFPPPQPAPGADELGARMTELFLRSFGIDIPGSPEYMPGPLPQPPPDPCCLHLKNLWRH
jgi:RHS repeat-associated protein